MSDWATAITQASAELNGVFGESITIGGTAYKVRLGAALAQYLEGDSGHQRMYVRTLTVDKAVLGTIIPRATAITATDGSYRVRAMTAEDYASRTYELVRG